MSADYCRLTMRSCLGAAIQRDWHQHDCPHSGDKGNALRPSEPSVVRERPTTQAGGSCFSVIRRVPGMSSRHRADRALTRSRRRPALAARSLRAKINQTKQNPVSKAENGYLPEFPDRGLRVWRKRSASIDKIP